MQTYIVQTGDTLYGISKQFGLPIEDIKLENNLDNNVITVGQLLRIPTLETTTLYVVKIGDTLYSIAKKFNTNVNELKRINNLNSNILSVGQQLRIPINELENNDNYAIYTVKVGDNLYSIASKYGVSVESIMDINNLDSSLLSIGQQLKIPVGVDDKDNQYGTYVVGSGDTLYSIAKDHGMTVNELMTINALTSSNLKVGQVLKVTSGGGVDSGIVLGSTCYGEGYQEPTYVTYTVKRGDNLYSIAKKYNVSVDKIIELNDLKNNNLSIGQVLKIKEV